MKEEKVITVKINKMSDSCLRAKIKKLIRWGDNSLYLKQLLLNAYERSSVNAVGWLRNICKEVNVSEQQKIRYYWILIKHQNENYEIGERIKYKDFVSIGRV